MPKSRRENPNNDGIPLSGAVDQVGFGDHLLDVICSAYGCLRGGVKILAEDANSSEAAAENWLRRRNQPRGGNLIAGRVPGRGVGGR